jgi:hypothetical protein
MSHFKFETEIGNDGSILAALENGQINDLKDAWCASIESRRRLLGSKAAGTGATCAVRSATPATQRDAFRAR